ncbi:MAG: ribonuclease PH [Deltaproteobacteria bacterium]|nr:MAG: ribonuclease PH [Deltaproteobacteria bacterium]
MERPDGRKPEQHRPVEFRLGVQAGPAGSVQVSFGRTVVLCAATVSEKVPDWISAQGREHGWITAEYAMLPGSAAGRVERRSRGRWEEIQRLVGRSLRAAVDLGQLGLRTITIDCDVIQADGGTRCASITGGWVALVLSIDKLLKEGVLANNPLRRQVCAVSCALLPGGAVCDPCYLEDSAARVDMNFVFDHLRDLVEIQGTAEDGTFSRQELDGMLELASAGAETVLAVQRKALDAAGVSADILPERMV